MIIRDNWATHVRERLHLTRDERERERREGGGERNDKRERVTERLRLKRKRTPENCNLQL